MAATDVRKIRPEDHSIPEEETGAERESIPLACIAPLSLIHPLLTASYMSSAAAYTLLSARITAWNWDALINLISGASGASQFQAVILAERRV